MSNRATIYSKQAPEAIGTYSHAVKMDNTVYLSGQIPLDPDTMELVEGGFEAQAEQVFKNLAAVCAAANGEDRKSTRLNSSHVAISYAVFCLKKKKSQNPHAHE